jgi:Flp pilus assembly protein TadD
VTDLVFAANLAVAGTSPLPFHATALALHLLASAFVFRLARRILERLGHPRAAPVAAFVGAIFALHPLQTESVCYVAQLAEVLSSVLYLGALLLLLRAFDATRRGPAWSFAAGAAALLSLALGAKSVAVTLPAAFLFVALAGDGDGPGARAPATRLRRALLLSAPAWAVAGAAIVRNLVGLAAEPTAGLSAGVGPWSYLLTQLRVQWLYLRLFVVPVGQAVEHPFSPSPGLAHAPTLGALAGTAAILAAAALLWRRGGSQRAASLGILWWFLLLAPTSTFVPIVDLVAEHRVYLALAGLALALGVGLDALAARLLPAPLPRLAAAAGLCAALGTATVARAAFWRTEYALWTDAVEKNPTSARVVGNHAFVLHKAGEYAAARQEYARALRIPAARPRLANVAQNYSALAIDQMDFDAALSIADYGIALSPHDVELRANRTFALVGLMRFDEALAEARLGVRLAPGEPTALAALGVALLANGDAAGALVELEKALRIDPTDAVARERRSAALRALGRRE